MGILLFAIAIWTFCDCSSLEEIFEKLSSNYFLIVAILLTRLTIWKIPSKQLCNNTMYSPETYAELQAEKVTYPLFGSLLSLGSFISASANSNARWGAFLLGLDILLLASISYRHITYAVYMQEYQRDKEKRICPFTPVKESCFRNVANPKTEPSKKNIDNTIQITCNTNANSPVVNVIERGTPTQYNPSKVFISLFMK